MKQTLSMEQMKHLQKLGLATANEAAYTLQDILGILPTELKPAQRRYWLRIDISDECIYYYYDDYNLVETRKKVVGYDGIDGLIDAAYEMLCWVIEQGYVETNKNE